MPLIYLTGLSGTGKSTVLRELEARGYEAHGVDEEGFADWIHRESGETIQFPHEREDEVDRHQWYRDHRWVLSAEKVSRLKRHSDETNRAVFLCGMADGEDGARPYFDRVVALHADLETLRERILQRTGNSFGKQPNEWEEVASWHEKYVGTYEELGAVLVDASRPLSEVVEAVLTAAGVPTDAVGLSRG